MVSSRLLFAGETVAMIQVFVRPPNESCNNLVSLDSLSFVSSPSSSRYKTDIIPVRNM